ncbi:157_t:CDS:2 [Diversispora eburnea]|uniref:GrpE protein homolog, mitochondrial n=1 Tax=Diversispora eburnea TaxID=1213867 RepID=A0A9N9ALG0_9GLOM|nr:157_t:CDS:2 [Diversispora eburnea]
MPFKLLFCNNLLISASRSLAKRPVLSATRNASTISKNQAFQSWSWTASTTAAFQSTEMPESSHINGFAQFSTTTVGRNNKEETATNSNDNGNRSEEKTSEKSTDNESDMDLREKEIAILKDKHLRCLAELENQREIARREVESTSQYAIQKFVKDILSTVDNLSFALNSIPPEIRSTFENDDSSSGRDLINLYKGIELTNSELLNTLRRHGIEKVEPQLGEKFDPKLHEALYQAAFPGKEAGTICEIQKIGYSLNGRIVRPPQVGVVAEAE